MPMVRKMSNMSWLQNHVRGLIEYGFDDNIICEELAELYGTSEEYIQYFVNEIKGDLQNVA